MMKRLILVLWLLLSIYPVFAQDGDIPARGNRLFVDDFTTYVNRWDRLHTAKFTVDYRNFAYEMAIRSPGVDVWATPDIEIDLLDRYVIQVTATIDPSSALDSFFGILLNFQDEDNFYVFGATHAGVYELWHRQNGEWLPPLVSGEFTPSSVYQLHVQDDYGTFEVRINDSPLLLVTDTDLSGGKFGLYGRAGHGTLLVAFDDYLVHDLDRTA